MNRKPLRSNRGYLSPYYVAIISLAFDKSQKVTRTLPPGLRLIVESVRMIGLSRENSGSLWAE